MGAAVRDLLGQAGTLLFQSLPGRSPGGGSDPGSLSACLKQSGGKVFLRALQNRSLINSFTERQCKAWLFTTARNLYCDQLRRTAKEEQLLSAFFPEEDRAEPDSALDTVEAASLLALLTPEERRLRYTAGYNASEIGQLLSLPPGTVRSRLAQIRHRLKTELTED